MKFKIYPFPEPINYFYFVKIAKTRRGMHAMMKRDRVPGDFMDSQALHWSYKKWIYSHKKDARAHARGSRKHARGKRSPEVGTMYFSADNLTPELIAHECMHASMNLIREAGWTKLVWRNPTKNTDREEIMVEAHGQMVQQIHEKTK